MIHSPNSVQIAELCPIQFTEPREYDIYNMQQEYVGKIKNFGFDLQILISKALYDNLEYIDVQLVDEADNMIAQKNMTMIELLAGVYYYATVNLDSAFFAGIDNALCRFKIFDDSSEVLADSIWYLINPDYDADLKKVQYSNLDNNWNTVFVDGATTYDFWLDVECGAIPKDSRDEQETEDFLEQDLVNDTVYGDEYEVVPFTFGSSMGIPNWLRKKISRATLCDTFKIDGLEYKRTQGAKMEKIEDTENGLATYKMDLQTPNNYLQ